MALEAKHITALDAALANGCKITVGEKDLTFSPLTFGDMGDVLEFNKSTSVQRYLAGIRGLGVGRLERYQTLYDLNMRACRPDDFDTTDTTRLIRMSWLSLRHKHPAMVEEDVAELLNVNENRELICDVMNVLTNGPAGDPDDPLTRNAPATT